MNPYAEWSRPTLGSVPAQRPARPGLDAASPEKPPGPGWCARPRGWAPSALSSLRVSPASHVGPGG